MIFDAGMASQSTVLCASAHAEPEIMADVAAIEKMMPIKLRYLMFVSPIPVKNYLATGVSNKGVGAAIGNWYLMNLKPALL